MPTESVDAVVWPATRVDVEIDSLLHVALHQCAWLWYHREAGAVGNWGCDVLLLGTEHACLGIEGLRGWCSPRAACVAAPAFRWMTGFPSQVGSQLNAVATRLRRERLSLQDLAGRLKGHE